MPKYEIKTWAQALPKQGVVVILGHRRRGKSALGWWIADRGHKAGRKVGAFHPSKASARLLPPWVIRIPDFKALQQHRNLIVVVDEASLDSVVTRYQELRNEAIPAADRASALEAFIREARLSGPDADAIRARALAAPPENHFDLMNLMTWASSHAIADPVRARRAQLTTSAWVSRDTHARVCPVCHRGSNAN